MERKKLIATGLLVGALAALLVYFGNPKNMGVCVICFLRDISGALGFHRAAVVQNLRLEIPGFILGSFVAALLAKEFRPRGGSSPILRFFMGMMVSVGALIFLGCPLRMVLRLAGGDMNALLGLAGFTVGVAGGVYFLKRGFTLGRSYSQPKAAGLAGPIFAMALVVLGLVAPNFIFRSTEAPGALAAPLLISLGAGLLIGYAAQRTRLCMAGGIRDLIMFKDTQLISGSLGILVSALVLNLIMGNFNLGFVGQPVAHSNYFYNFLGMVVTGLGATLLGGCPLRQLILAGEGDVDAMTTVLGLLMGGALAHNFGLAASGKGVPVNGQVAVWGVLVVLLLIGWGVRETVQLVRTQNSSKGVKA